MFYYRDAFPRDSKGRSKAITPAIKKIAPAIKMGTELVKSATFRCSTAPIDITVNGNIIAVADLMKSLVVVQFSRGENGLPDTLSEISRHYQTTWATAVAEVDENTYLESDAEGNLAILYRDPNGVTEDDKRRLNVSAEMQLGEMVNRIRRIDVATAPDAAVVPRAFMATVSHSSGTLT